MSFLDTLKQWDRASTVADGQEFSEALGIFLSIEEPNSKIYFNIGCLHLLNEDLKDAEKVNFKYEYNIILHSHSLPKKVKSS